MLIYNIMTMLMHFTATATLTFKVKFNKMGGFLMTVIIACCDESKQFDAQKAVTVPF